MDFVNDKGVQKAKQMANKEKKKKRDQGERNISLLPNAKLQKLGSI